jgi:putative hemolysin
MLEAIGIEILVIFVPMLANGFFSGSEIAVVSARRSRLQQQVDAGSKRAQEALDLSNNPDRFLATVQVGITLIGTFASAFGGASIGDALAAWLHTFPATAPYAESLALAIVVLFITYVSLVIGELVPKRWALQHAEKVAIAVTPVMNVLARLLAPAVGVLTGSVSLIMRLLGPQQASQSSVTEEDIAYVIRQGMAVGVVEPGEARAIRRVFQFTERPVRAVMTPRTEMAAVDAAAPLHDVAAAFVNSGYSRLPVYEGAIDRIVGVLYANDVLRVVTAPAEGSAERSGADAPAPPVDLDIRKLVRPATFLVESQHLDDALLQFRQQGTHFGIVVDEYGEVAGIVTLQDLLEELIGEMPEASGVPGGPGQSGERAYMQREDGSWLVDAMEPYDRVLEHLGMTPIAGEPGDHRDFTTLAGMIMARLGRVPSAGDTLQVDDHTFEVVAMDGQRIDRVLVREHHEPPEVTGG